MNTYRSPFRTPSLQTIVTFSATVLVLITTPLWAQDRSGVGGLGDPASFMRPTGARLALEILTNDSSGMTLRARPGQSSASGESPLSYCALIGIPAGQLLAVEVHEVASIPAGGTAVETAPWDGPKINKPGSELAAVEDLGWMRHQRIGRLIVRPWMIDPFASQSPQLVSLTLRIRFAKPVERDTTWTDSQPYEQVLRHALTNYEVARGYRTEVPGAQQNLAPLVPDPTAEHVVLRLHGGGLCALTGLDLRRAGVDTARINPKNLQVWHLGRELPLHLDPEEGSFGDDSTVFFFAPEIPPTLKGLSGTNIVGLAWNGNDGLRMPTRPAFVGHDPISVSGFEAVRLIGDDTVRVEGDHSLGQTWFWHRLSAEQGAPDSRFLVIPDIGALVPGGQATLRLALHGLTSAAGHDIDHHIRVNLNNRWSKDFFWKGKTPFVVNETLQSDLLVEGNNVVELRVTGELEVFADQVLVDWLELQYPTWGESGGVFSFSDQRPARGLYEYRVYGRRGLAVRVFETTDPNRPVLVTDPTSVREDLDSVSFQVDWKALDRRSFAVTSIEAIPAPTSIEYRTQGRNLLQGMAHADLLVVTHAALLSAVEKLVGHRTNQGLDTALVTTDEIYAHFSHGFPTPQAIRSLAAVAFHRWPKPAPSFLLLVGDASNDPLDRLGYGARNLVPTYLPTDGAYPSDAWVGFVSGDDQIPDLMVGRLSASSAATIAVMADKIIDYEAAEGDQTWKRRVLVVADDDPREVYLEEARSTGERIDGLGFESSGIYLDEIEFAADDTFADRAEITNRTIFPRLRDAINRGVGLVHYFGHGGFRVWAREHILNARPESPHLGQLTNRERLPVILSFSCINAAFDNPRFDTIAERLVGAPHGGAVAFWGSGGNNNPVVRWAVATAIRDTLGEAEQLRLGTALTLAGLDTLRANGFMENGPTDANILLGDPATVLSFPLE